MVDTLDSLSLQNMLKTSFYYTVLCNNVAYKYKTNRITNTYITKII